jgi:dihydropyrimidinase
VTDLSTVIRSVDAVLPHGVVTLDLGVAPDGRIGALGAPGSLRGADIVDGHGLVAIPGGIDLHVHMNTLFGGTTTRDDFLAGSSAALFGGTTTFAQFAIPRDGESMLNAIGRTREEANPSVADYAVHGSVVKETYEASLPQLAAIADAGVRTVKIFTAYTDAIGLSMGQVHRLLRNAASAGATVFVHAETDALIREGIEEAVVDGGLGPTGHSRSRTPLAEDDAVRSVADLALDTGASVYFVHISSAAAVETLGSRRAGGQRLLAETCPHYLFLDESVYDRPDGERWICSPPIRSAEHQAALWNGLRAGVIDTVSSDHNCFDTHQKEAGRDDFRRVPNGLPGIEHRLPLLIGGVLAGQLTWSRLVQISAENPARIVGLWPRKGVLAVGSDADVVLVDPVGTTDLSISHMATDYSPYDGMTARGRIRFVLRRGEVVVADGALRAEAGSGTWLAAGDQQWQ